MSIFFLFEPQKTEQKEFGEVPLLHIKRFTMYEFDPNSLKTLMYGSEAFRYSDRYTIDNIDHSDNSKLHISNLKAKYGLYKDNTLHLDGNVTFVRDDGLKYQTQSALYYKDKSLFVTDTNYKLTQAENSLRGSSLDYNNITGKIHSKNIEAIYYIKERK